jgi:ubiquinone/menaquinone biosynthesis C-methylase UbiE
MRSDATGGGAATGDVFDRMAAGWYGFRHRSIFLPELAELAGRWKGGRLLNLGCGHGPDFVPFTGGDFDLHGVDFSREMLLNAVRYSARYGFSVSLVLADMTRLPYAGGTFDHAIAVASLHHLNRRQQPAALAELRRVLKPGAEALITVWNRWQRRFWFAGRETAVPWRTGGETLHRYYYLFSYAELERLARRSGFRVLRSFPERSYRWPVKAFSRNICLLVRKD